MDAVKFLFAFLAVIIPAIVAALVDSSMWVWVAAWFSTLFLFIGYEIYGKFISKEKETISKTFWNFKKKHPVIAWCFIGGWLGFSIYLALHLGFGL